MPAKWFVVQTFVCADNADEAAGRVENALRFQQKTGALDEYDVGDAAPHEPDGRPTTPEDTPNPAFTAATQAR